MPSTMRSESSSSWQDLNIRQMTSSKVWTAFMKAPYRQNHLHSGDCADGKDLLDRQNALTK